MTSRVVLSFAALLAALASAAARAESFQGREFPDFDARDPVNGGEFSLSDLRGKVVVVDFWATWCGPCVAEIPNVQQAWSRYRDRGLEIVSISLDDNKSKFLSFVKSRKMDWRHVMDGGGWKTRLAKKYGINSIPRMLVIGPDGVVIADNARGPQLEQAIERGLAKVGPKPSGEEPDRAPAEKPRRKERKPADETPDAPAPDRRERRAPDPDPPADTRPAVDLSDLAEARRALNDLAAPLAAVDDRLARLSESIDQIQRQLLLPADPQSAARRVARLHQDLIDARHELFMLGLIDEQTTVPVPPDPLASASPRAPSAWADVHRALPAFRSSVEALGAAAGNVETRIGELTERIAGLEREAARAGRGASFDRDLKETRSEASALVARLSGAWVGQLETAEHMITRCCEPLEATRARLDSVDERVASIRSRVEEAPRETEALTTLREDFGTLCEELEAAASHISGERPVLPVNPFESRRLRDIRALAEAREQLQVASDAAATLRSRTAEARQRYDKLAARTAEIRAEVDARRGAGRSLEDLRKRFADLSREVLALHDRPASA